MAGLVNKEEMKQCLKDANIYEDNLSDDLISQYYKAIKNSESSLIGETKVEEGTKSLNDSANELLEAINNSESVAPTKKRRLFEKNLDNDEESLDGLSPDSFEQAKPKPIEDEANNNYNHATDVKAKKVQKSSRVMDIDKITFNEMPKSSNRNTLRIVPHEPQYISVQNSRQFLDADLQTRVKLLTEYHSAVAQLSEDFARTLPNMAPKLKPITAVNHNLLVNPVLSALKEDKALGVTETYVSRSGRMTKRKVYSDDYEATTEEFSVPHKKSKNDDTWGVKAPIKKSNARKGESSEALSSSSAEDACTTKQYSRPKRGESPDSSQDVVAVDEAGRSLGKSKDVSGTPKSRIYQKRQLSNQEIIARSTLFKNLDTTPKRGRVATILHAAREKEENRRREEDEMSKFADSLDAQSVDGDADEDEILDSEHVEDSDVEVVEKRRVIPRLPIRRSPIWGKKGATDTVAETAINVARKLNLPQITSPLANGANRNSLLSKRALNNNSSRAEVPVSTTPKSKSKQNLAICPLCSMSFPRREIEEHASTCGEDMFPQSSQPQRITCEVCDAVVPFSTNYEVHVKECIAKRSSRT
uniref:UBZ4-type domain-containing protein n=1 Tax=Dendroctonus ponderosae TaxID=77166 RepID=A0AAR5Q2N7_DENPD